MEKTTGTEEVKKLTTKPDGGFSLKLGSTTYNIGLHFSKASTESMEDKVKRLIEKDIKAGNF